MEWSEKFQRTPSMSCAAEDAVSDAIVGVSVSNRATYVVVVVIVSKLR